MTSRRAAVVSVAHLSLPDFRSYAEVELPLDAGRHRARRPQRPGQDQPGRGGRLPRDARLAPGRRRRAAGAAAAPSARWCAAQVVRDDRPTAGRAGDHPGQGQPGAGQPRRRCRGPRDVLGILRTVLFAPEDLALVKGDPAERRRFLDDLLVARAPRFAGVRADYDRVLKQRNALLQDGGPAAAPSRWRPAHPRRLGRAPRHRRRRAAGRAGSSWSRRCGRWSTRPTQAVADRRRLGRAGRARLPVARWARTLPLRRRPRACWPRRCSTELAEVRARPSSSAASPWSARTATSWCSKLGAAAGQGLRQPRRVLVVRAGAAAGVLRPAPRRDRPAASRCWSSTTCSPSSTTTGASGWPSWSAGAEQVLVTAAVPGRRARGAGRRAGRRHGRRGPACPMSRADRQTSRTRSTPARRTGLEIAREALASARAEARKRGLAPGRAPALDDRGDDPAGRRRRRSSPSSAAAPTRTTATRSCSAPTLGRLVAERGWETDAAVGGVMGRWAAIVGPEVAGARRPVALRRRRAGGAAPTRRPGRPSCGCSRRPCSPGCRGARRRRGRPR